MHQDNIPSKITCPACGSDKFETIKETKLINEAYGNPLEVNLTFHKCLACDAEGDFTDQNDEVINHALVEARKSSVQNIIDSFSRSGINLSGIERAFRLPQRTLNKWRNSSPSASGLALLKTIRTYPWIIEVAENDFNPTVAMKVHMHSAVEQISNLASRTTGYNQNSITFNAMLVNGNLTIYNEKSPHIQTNTVNEVK